MVVIGPTRTGWLEMSEWEESQTSQPERINCELGTSLPYLPGSNLLMRLTETQNKLLFDKRRISYCSLAGLLICLSTRSTVEQQQWM